MYKDVQESLTLSWLSYCDVVFYMYVKVKMSDRYPTEGLRSFVEWISFQSYVVHVRLIKKLFLLKFVSIFATKDIMFEIFHYSV